MLEGGFHWCVRRVPLGQAYSISIFRVEVRVVIIEGIENRWVVGIEERFARGCTGVAKGGPGEGLAIFVVHAGKAEFDCFVELLRGGEVDAKFETGFGVLVVAGGRFDSRDGGGRRM